MVPSPDVARLNVVGLASPQLQQLFAWLEVEFDPLTICHNVHSVVQALNEEPSEYYTVQLLASKIQKVYFERVLN